MGAEIENLPKALPLHREVMLTHQHCALTFTHIKKKKKESEQIHRVRARAFTLLKVSLSPVLNMALRSCLLGERPENASDVWRRRAS